MVLFLVFAFGCGGSESEIVADPVPIPDPGPLPVPDPVPEPDPAPEQVPGISGWLRTPSSIDPTAAAGNVHFNSGGRRQVRINGTTIALVNDGSYDKLYRSNNDGEGWVELDSEPGYSGCLVSGKGNYVYHFSRGDGRVRMVKFLYSSTVIPAPVTIYPNLQDSNHGAYAMINATVNSLGHIFVFYHHDTGGIGADSLYLLRSTDEGATWSSPILVRQGTGSGSASWGFVHSDVDINSRIIIVYCPWDSSSMQFARSMDNGDSWTTTEINSVGTVFNPAVLPVGDSEVFVFAQSVEDDGLVYKKSSDSGSTWSHSWLSIQANHGNGYADPSPALGNDGTIYVAFRGAAIFTTLSDDLREYVAMSADGGQTWSFPDNHLSGGRVGTRSTMRYQTWFNYGGPLEWTWLEEEGEDSGIFRTMYDCNTDVNIANITP